MNRLESGDFVTVRKIDIMPMTVGRKVMMDHSTRRPGASAILTHGLEAKLIAWRHVRCRWWARRGAEIVLVRGLHDVATGGSTSMLIEKHLEVCVSQVVRGTFLGRQHPTSGGRAAHQVSQSKARADDARKRKVKSNRALSPSSLSLPYTS